MARLTDRQGTLVATVDVQTGAFTWESPDLAPQSFHELVDAPVLLRVSGYTSPDGKEVTTVVECKKGTAEWAALLPEYLDTYSDGLLEWHGP